MTTSSTRAARGGVFAASLCMLALVLGLTAACQGNPSSPNTPYQIITATPGGLPGGPTLTPEPTVPYVIAGMPPCPGLRNLGAPLKFDWPDIENALEKLKDYNWGYYRCAMTAPELITFLHAGMVKPPYLWQFINMAEHNNGRVSLFYQPFQVIWIYIWMLPGPDDRSSYLVIAKGEPGFPSTWDCRLPVYGPLAGRYKGVTP